MTEAIAFSSQQLAPETAETVSGCILSGAAVVGYIIGEGLTDAAHKEDNDD